jgi:membrane protease YdiL (CAAX protease family)
MIEKATHGSNKWTLYLLSTVIVFLATQLGGIPMIVYVWMKDPAYLTNGKIMEISGTNMGFALMLLSFVAGFFALMLCVKYIHRKNYLDIITSRLHFDWKRALFAAGIWALLSIISIGITLSMRDSADIVFQFQPLNFFILVLVALILMPFQTSFEELFFRGYLMQGSAL